VADAVPIVTVAPLTTVPVTIFVTVPLNVTAFVDGVAVLVVAVAVGATGVVELLPPHAITDISKPKHAYFDTTFEIPLSDCLLLVTKIDATKRFLTIYFINCSG
jgi:hypothetical protein